MWRARARLVGELGLRNKSGLALWKNDLNADIKIAIEKHWKKDVFVQNMNKSAKPFYVLSMFPYPSGALHLGHVRVYSISDTIARFHKLNGVNVIHPMGWDAFGLPAENAALERGVAPQKWTMENIEAMREQLVHLGFNFDWDRELTTCSADYYKWTQYIFLKLFEKGLAYRLKAVVNWDPVDQTVLADEQVDTNGCSWRSGAKVEKKLLKQWYIKTTKFAKQLYDGLNDDTLMEWKDIINLQKHWIGECEGITVTFSLKCKENILLDSLNIWASEPEKFVHGQFITISHQHILAQDILMRNCETSTSHVVAHNPITDTELPVYVTDAADYPEGRDVYIASPKTCPKDVVLAVELNLPVCTQTVEVDLSEKLTVAEIAQQKNVGGYPVSSKLRDWLISRQRYWGTPIPIIHCNCCGVVPVPYDDLPVMLPEAASIAANGSPLAEVASRPDCTCPGCGSPAKRETDTMDTFVDSSWYFLRYLDPLNSNAPFDPDKVKGSTPVDLYIGGKEHAVLHLYYARFMTHFLHSLGWTSSPEPFKSLLVQGMIMGKSYKVKSTGKYLPPDKVEFVDDRPIEKGSGYVVETQWEKMSKSKYNGESPQNLLSLYGCDTTRLFMLADVPPAAHRHWSDATFPGILNWQHRLWLTVRELLEHRNNEHLCELTTEEFKKHEDKLWEARNYFTSATTYNYKYTHQLSVAISRMQGLTNSLRRTPEAVVAKSGEYELALSALIIMLAPIAPHFCCELWAGLVSAPHRVHDGDAPINWEGTVFEQSWPRIDDSFNLSFLCKVDGADRCNLKILPKDLDVLSHQKALQVMLGEKSIAKRVKKGIARTEFEKYPGCRAILNIFTKQVQKETKDKIQAANEQQ